ncbi:MAG TPA: class 1 fructose-bisphosphatase [Candidatus Kapabacteria bacterium]|jgi:fructose-1,6-bisphosphatase I|nr:class 1 fructose-bisphosphatase [Candidatus Kapabacteria bacterium]
MRTNKLITIDHHIANEKSLHPYSTGEFSALLHDIALAIRIISREVRRAGLNEMFGLTGEENPNGDKVRKLDKFANEIIKNLVLQNGNVCCIASEEEKDLVYAPNNANAKYILVYDPLDGSANIDVNITIGSIFSIYRRLQDNIPVNINDVLQCGAKQVAAGYALYGSSTLLVYTTGNGVNVFTYDPTLGEFFLTQKNLKIPPSGYIYSCNEGNYYKWKPQVRQFVDYLKGAGGNNSSYMLRYIASGVADIHRTLLYGGIYLYPEDASHPTGKFRLVYEANALAMIVEQAGGKATDGNHRILEVHPTSIHQTTPLIIGSPNEVSLYEKYYRQEMNL